MPTLVDFQAAVRDGLAADPRLVELRAHVSAHGGEFTIEALTRYAKQAPAVVIGLLRADTENVGGGLIATVTVGVAVLAKDAPGVTRHDQALNLADATMRALRGRFWRDSLTLSAPKEIASKNLYAPKLDGLGVAMWAIAFDQELELTDTDPSVPLAWVHLDWDVAPSDGAIDAQDDIRPAQP